MNVEWDAWFAGDVFYQFEDFEVPAGAAADFGMGYHTAHDVSVGPARSDRCLYVHLLPAIQRWTETALHAADQIHGDEAQYEAFRRLGDEMTKPRDGHATRVALIHQSGDAGAHADHLGIQSEPPGDVLANMSMRVDHPGDDDFPRDIQHLTRRRGGKRGFDRGDDIFTNADVGDIIAPRCRVDDPSTE
jgi:hypothetical protein